MEAGSFFSPNPSEFLGGQAPVQLARYFAARSNLNREYKSADEYLAEGEYPGRGAGMFGRSFAPNVVVGGPAITPQVAIPASVVNLQRRARYVVKNPVS
jgi:hypothetical protein